METRYSIAKVSRIRKVTKFEAIIRVERDILGMNISMNDLILVASPNGVQQFEEVEPADPFVKTTLSLHKVLEICQRNVGIGKERYFRFSHLI